MGVQINIGSIVGESKFYKFAAKVPLGLEGAYFFGKDASLLEHNFAPNKNAPKLIGHPELFDGYARFKGLKNYIDTGIQETEELTCFIICKTTETEFTSTKNRPMFFGTYKSPRQDTETLTYGVSLYTDAINKLTFANTILINDTESTTGGTSYGTANIQQFALYGLRIARDKATLRDFTNNTTQYTSPMGQNKPRIVTSGTFNIGSGKTVFEGSCDISSMLIYSRALTDDELSIMAEQLRKNAARKGIII